MQRQIVITEASIAPSGTAAQSEISAGLYAADYAHSGSYRPVRWAVYSEGLCEENPTNAPDWGDWDMYTDGALDVSFDMQWDLVASFSPTTYSLQSGSLPDGLTLQSVSGNKGRLYGTPTAEGTFNFTLRATNAYGEADQSFSITIVAPSGGAGGGAFTFLG